MLSLFVMRFLRFRWFRQRSRFMCAGDRRGRAREVRVQGKRFIAGRFH